MWVTYAFYDEKGRRLTIVGRVVADSCEEQQDGTLKFENPQLEIHVVTCSKHDEFSRKKVRTLVTNLQKGFSVKDLGFHPVVHLIPIKDDKPKWTFINWCRENYYHREVGIFMFDAYILAKGNEALRGIHQCTDFELVDFQDIGRKRLAEDLKHGV